MKNINIIFISLLFVFTASFGEVNAATQESSLKSKDKDKIDSKKKEQFEAIGNLLREKSFVLEAEWLRDKYGNRVYVSPTINFVKVDKPEAVLQIGSNHGFGYNGLGGITAEGTLSEMKIKENEKKLVYYVQMTFMTSIGTYDVNMNVDSNGWADASVTGLRSGRLTYQGDLVALENSRIYKGNTTY